MVRNNLNRTLWYALLCASVSVFALSFSEVKAEDDSFFGQDFARQPGGELPTIEPKSAPRKLPPRPTSVAGTLPEDKKKEIEEAARAVSQEARELKSEGRLERKPTPVPPTGKQTMVVLEVGGILDGTKTQALNEQITDVVALTDAKKRKISVLYVVGGEDSVPVSLRLEVLKRGGQIRFVRELPKKYGAVKLSPTWILAGNDQEILIEGAGGIRDNLSPEGAIITRATEKVTPVSVGSSRPSRLRP